MRFLRAATINSVASVNHARVVSRRFSHTPLPLPLHYPQLGRVVAFGDVHGDHGALMAALELGRAVDAAGRWVGEPALRVVQTGDLLDRGPDERRIMDTVARLSAEARAAGSHLHLLLGNHEIMALRADDDYMHPEAHEGWDRRRAAHMPTRLAALFAAAVVIDRTLFVHAGLTLDAAQALPTINRDVQAYIAGRIPSPPALDAITWLRDFHGQSDDSALKLQKKSQLLTQILRLANVDRVVCGHTPRETVHINSTFDNRIFNIDLPLNQDMQADYLGVRSNAMDLVKVQVLEIPAAGAEPRVLESYRPARTQRH